jgi:hypothetical protein
MNWQYDEERQVYVNADTGEEVSTEELILLLALLVRSTKRKLKRIAKRMTDDELSPEAGITQAALILKSAHLLAASLARGGRRQMRPKDWGKVGADLKKQYKYLTRFEKLILKGKLTATQIIRRLALYGDSISRAFHTQLADVQSSLGNERFARRYLRASESCKDCIRYAARGWVPVAELVPPTADCECGFFCKCVVKFRTGKE